MKALTNTEEDLLLAEPEDRSNKAPLQEDGRSMRKFNPIDLITLLAFRKWLIGTVTSAWILLGGILCIVIPVRFTAVTKLMPPQQTQSTASMLMSQLNLATGGSLSAMASGGLGLRNPNDLYIGLLSSRPVADAIIRRFNLAVIYRVKDMTTARKALESHTAIVSEKNGFISVSVEDKDRNRAAEMANAYTEELRKITDSLAVTEASQRRLFYEKQIKQARETLIADAFAFEKIQQEKGLVQLDAQSKAMIQGLASLRAQAAAKQVEIDSIRSYSTDQNPELQMAQKQLASLQDEEAHIEKRSKVPGIAGLGLESVPGAGLEYLRAEHELQYQQALIDMLMRQYNAAKLDESKEATIIQVVESAIPPDRKSSPHRAEILLLCALIGFLASCIYLYLSNYVEKNPDILNSLKDLRIALKLR
jgi:tyrosine-protein kinase Etk/Wzc